MYVNGLESIMPLRILVRVYRIVPDVITQSAVITIILMGAAILWFSLFSGRLVVHPLRRWRTWFRRPK